MKILESESSSQFAEEIDDESLPLTPSTHGTPIEDEEDARRYQMITKMGKVRRRITRKEKRRLAMTTKMQSLPR